MDWLAALLGAVEKTWRWSGALTHGYTTLVPKEGPPGALNTPLTLLSMVYRRYVGYSSKRQWHGRSARHTSWPLGCRRCAAQRMRQL